MLAEWAQPSRAKIGTGCFASQNLASLAGSYNTIAVEGYKIKAVSLVYGAPGAALVNRSTLWARLDMRPSTP
jgi:hypothetical protein